MSDSQPSVAAPEGAVISLSLDIDNQWAYMRTHGDPGWEEFPTYLEPLFDTVLPWLDRERMRITFFVVGKDAALDKNRDAFRRLGASGHEVGNHSFLHEQWLHLYSPEDLERDLGAAEEHIQASTGHRTRGFRGPGFSLSAATLDVLARRGYRYDASTFPTFLGPLARLYYFWGARNLSKEERAKRSQLFGTLADGLQPLDPYVWQLTAREDLVEIPVTTMPLARAPFHMSYLLYLSRYSKIVALAYLELALGLCRLTGVEPSFLLHPLDFLGCDQVDGLRFFPGMDLTTATKLEFVTRAIARIRRNFTPITMDEHAARALSRASSLRRIRFRGGTA